MNVERCTIVERYTGIAFITGFPILVRGLAIDRLGKDPGAGGLADPTGTAEQKGMRQLVVLNGILKGSRDMRLPDHRSKILGSVLSRRNYKFIHGLNSCGKPTAKT